MNLFIRNTVVILMLCHGSVYAKHCNVGFTSNDDGSLSMEMGDFCQCIGYDTKAATTEIPSPPVGDSMGISLDAHGKLKFGAPDNICVYAGFAKFSEKENTTATATTNTVKSEDLTETLTTLTPKNDTKTDDKSEALSATPRPSDKTTATIEPTIKDSSLENSTKPEHSTEKLTTFTSKDDIRTNDTFAAPSIITRPSDKTSDKRTTTIEPSIKEPSLVNSTKHEHSTETLTTLTPKSDTKTDDISAVPSATPRPSDKTTSTIEATIKEPSFENFTKSEYSTEKLTTLTPKDDTITNDTPAAPSTTLKPSDKTSDKMTATIDPIIKESSLVNSTKHEHSTETLTTLTPKSDTKTDDKSAVPSATPRPSDKTTSTIEATIKEPSFENSTKPEYSTEKLTTLTPKDDTIINDTPAAPSTTLKLSDKTSDKMTATIEPFIKESSLVNSTKHEHSTETLTTFTPKYDTKTDDKSAVPSATLRPSDKTTAIKDPSIENSTKSEHSTERLTTLKSKVDTITNTPAASITTLKPSYMITDETTTTIILPTMAPIRDDSIDDKLPSRKADSSTENGDVAATVTDKIEGATDSRKVSNAERVRKPPQEKTKASSVNYNTLIILFGSIIAGIIVVCISKCIYKTYKTKSYVLPTNQRQIELQSNKSSDDKYD